MFSEHTPTALAGSIHMIIHIILLPVAHHALHFFSADMLAADGGTYSQTVVRISANPSCVFCPLIR